MENKQNILEIKNLRISFKTNSGTVKATRGIDLTLEKGKTLAIVGESGSGKSVTSKAILGILSKNKIIEDGEIIYDGKDLLTLPEKKFNKIRGVKISMIFQDPLSALNPIMRVGKQLTEAMYLENKSLIKEAKKYLNKMGGYLNKVDKEQYKELKFLNGSTLPSDELYEEIKTYKDLFYKTATMMNEEYIKNISEARELIEHYFTTYFHSESKELNLKGLLKDLKPIETKLKKCHNIFSLEADDTIDVYSLLIRKNIKNYLNSEKEINHQTELFTKYNIDDIYQLDAKYRAWEKEVINPPYVYFNNMKIRTQNIIYYLDVVIKKYSQISDEDIDSLMHEYSKMVVQKNKKLSQEETKNRAIELMREVGIPGPETRFYQYPFEFSGGMRQRIVIAIALSGNPEVLICDEPTTALDVTIQAQILELIKKLKKEKDLSIIFITHDLGVVANMADDIAVMYAGKIVEYGSVFDIFYDPRHPYTWALLSSMPDLNTKGKLDAIPGTPPNMLLPPKGDAFASRNAYATTLDYKQEPPLFKISESHFAKTWLLHKDAPDVTAPKTVITRIKKSLSENSENTPTYELKKNSILEYIKGGNK